MESLGILRVVESPGGSFELFCPPSTILGLINLFSGESLRTSGVNMATKDQWSYQVDDVYYFEDVLFVHHQQINTNLWMFMGFLRS